MQPIPYEGNALPIELQGLYRNLTTFIKALRRGRLVGLIHLLGRITHT
ncbi:hypothetical protein LILPANDA_257 [Klebsiella phage vB_KaeM_LilPanda]|nr:hypothetical protein LILPANDA_257 [Klebsiella phage vB_KaeM_LilPanda]